MNGKCIEMYKNVRSKVIQKSIHVMVKATYISHFWPYDVKQGLFGFDKSAFVRSDCALQ